MQSLGWALTPAGHLPQTQEVLVWEAGRRGGRGVCEGVWGFGDGVEGSGVSGGFLPSLQRGLLPPS